MKRSVKIIVLCLILFLMEYVILFLCLQLESAIGHSIPFSRFDNALRDASEIGLMRLIFYSVFWVLMMSFIYDRIGIKNRLLKLSLTNVGLYILTSAIMSLIFPFAIEFFTRPFFFYLVIATLVSPCVLYLIPFGKRIIETI